MATRIEKIIASARRTLADQDAQRWTDNDLLAILQEGQVDFAQQTEILKGESYIYLEAGNPHFDLPEDCWRLTRALSLGTKLPFLTHYQIDSQYVSYRGPFGQSSGTSWETNVGKPQAIIYDRRSQTQGKVYPIPEVSGVDTNSVQEVVQVASGDYVMDTFGVAHIITGYTLSSPYGVTAEDTAFGVISDPYNLTNPDDTVIIPEEESEEGVIRIYYTRFPTGELTLESELETPPVYDIALKFYLTGHALFDDIDTAWQAKGQQQLAIYDRHVETAKRDRASNFTRAHTHQTMYRRGV